MVAQVLVARVYKERMRRTTEEQSSHGEIDESEMNISQDREI